MGGYREKIRPPSAKSLVTLLEVLAILWVLLSPSGAAAAPMSQRPFPPAGFSVQGTNGYRLTVEAETRNKVALYAAKPGGAVLYSAPGSFDGRTIQAQFGSLGSVSMTFHRTGVRRFKPRCSHQSFRVMKGTFRGSFSFAGEEGFTTATAETGRAVSGVPAFCTAGGVIGSGRGAELDAFGTLNGDEQVTWAIAKEDPSSKADMFARISELREGMLISRSAGAVGPRNTFSWDPAVRSAQVFSPGPPFTGEAAFSRPANVTGSLTVSFPGESNVLLAGPDFAGRLYRIG
jgi:hypothetical protein